MAGASMASIAVPTILTMGASAANPGRDCCCGQRASWASPCPSPTSSETLSAISKQPRQQAALRFWSLLVAVRISGRSWNSADRIRFR
jgi:hypothetical protein